MTDVPSRARAARGFTLIELMVVIVILAGLITLVGPNVWKALFESKDKTARMQIKNFSDAIGMYLLSEKQIPQSLDELAQPDKNGQSYVKNVPMDPWSQPYNYTPRNRAKGDYEISSAGSDQQLGTADDIVYSSSDGKFKGD